MTGRIFLIHWHALEAAELATPLEQAGWQVETEAEDGARAGKRLLANPPVAAVIYLTRLPSHVRVIELRSAWQVGGQDPLVAGMRSLADGAQAIQRGHACDRG